MSSTTGIQWTDATWNPVTGCSKVSPGCKNCYAESMAKRLQRMGSPNYREGFAVTLQPQALDLPTRWTRPRRVFVNSMSDLFHEAVPLSYVDQVWWTMLKNPRHTFQVLTKRPARMRDYLAGTSHPAPWIHVGTSVETLVYLHRVEALRRTPAGLRFLSLEPLLGPFPRLPLEGIGWVIVGGESGPGARPMAPNWVRDIREQCLAARVPFFFKQWGGVRKATAGRVLDGRTWDEFPATATTRGAT